MAIITISRELATLGDETARELAKLPGYRFVDKHSLEERIKSYGIESQKFSKYDERKPSVFAALSQDRNDYLHYLKTAMFAEAEQGNCVFIGRGAASVFKNMPAHISVFLAAPLAVRIERVKSYFHCDERRARQIIEHSDQDRIGFHRYFFDIDWRHPGNYHLSINTGIFHPAVCAEIVKQLMAHSFTEEAEAHNAAHLQNLIFEQKIKHHITYEKKILIHFLEVSVDGGIITMYGVTNSQAAIDAAADAASEAAGSGEGSGPVTIRNEIQIVHEYSMIP
jgi:cytidylate kinase